METQPGWYFVVLPDRAAAGALADRFDTAAHHVLSYRSGRPMLIARTHVDQFVMAEAGPARCAVIGCSSATTEGLRQVLGGIRGVRTLDLLCHRLAGSFHLVATDGDCVRVQGAASGLRRVYHAIIDGVPVAADRADVLARLGGFRLDECSLAMRLAHGLPQPFLEDPLWPGVTPVPPAEYLSLDRRGLRTVRWWRRPEPDLFAKDGSLALRAALEEAVAVRTRAGGIVHCDLSGGLDSTPLCYLAAQGPAEIHALTLYNEDPGGKEDLLWARRALPSMPSVRHSVGATETMPQFFDGMADLTERLDEPTQAHLAAPRIRHSINSALADGARLYLNGLGGDHLLTGRPIWDHSIIRRRPVHGWRRARTARLLTNRPIVPLLRDLMKTEPYHQWLRRTVSQVRVSAAPGTPPMDWEQTITLPRWLSAEATASVIARMKRICADVRPLGPDRARHAELALVRDGSRIARGIQQFGSVMGMPFEAPFFDDRVIEAVVAVRHEERASPLEFKPLIKESMRGALPDDFLLRSSKRDGSAQTARGLRDHRWSLLRICEQSPLVERGIIDLAALMDSQAPERLVAGDQLFQGTVNCAVFLRNQALVGLV